MRSLLCLAILGTLLTPSVASAQSATPGATPAPCPHLFCGSIDPVRLATREYDATGFNPLGFQSLVFLVSLFDTQAQAQKTFATVGPYYEMRFKRNDFSNSTMAPTSVRSFGDESAAFSGSAHSNAQDRDYVYAIVVTRVGKEVRTAFGAGIAPSTPITVLADILQKSLNHLVASTVVSEVKSGMLAGGAYEALPRLSDLPEGFKFVADDVN